MASRRKKVSQVILPFWTSPTRDFSIIFAGCQASEVLEAAGSATRPARKRTGGASVASDDVPKSAYKHYL
jgi:hypothetical protein